MTVLDVFTEENDRQVVLISKEMPLFAGKNNIRQQKIFRNVTNKTEYLQTLLNIYRIPNI